MVYIKIFSIVKHIGRNISARFVNVGRNSGVHGIKYVFDVKGTRLTRFIWLVILILFSGCLYSLLIPVIKRGKEVSFVADTGYLHWQINFPAVTVCETFSHQKVEKKLAEEFPDLLANLNYGYRRHISDLIFGRGSCSKSVCEDCGSNLACDVPWRDIIERVHKSCNEVLTDCSFNNNIFSCCKEYRIVDSVSGPCFSFNTLQSKNRSGSSFLVNRTTGPGLLSFRLLTDAQVTLHSSEELSTSFMDKKYKFEIKTLEEKHVNILFNAIQVEIDPRLGEEDITVRKCRHNNEIPDEPLHSYPVYSYGSCRLSRSTYKSFQRCGCVHPARDVSLQKIKLGVDDESSSSDCLPACKESQLTIIHYSTGNLFEMFLIGLYYLNLFHNLGDEPLHVGYRRSDIEENNEGSLVELKMATLPTLKYNKMLMRTNLDLVVTVGGVVALFFSASILSLAEIFYLMFRS